MPLKSTFIKQIYETLFYHTLFYTLYQFKKIELQATYITNVDDIIKAF